MLLHTGVPLTKRLPFPKGELSAKLTEGWPLRRSWSIPPSRLRRATVPQFNMVASLRSHRTALRLPGVPWLRTVLRSVCSPLQPFGPPPFAKRTCDVPLFHWGLRTGLRFAARYSGAAERFALSSPLHPFGASTTTACFATGGGLRTPLFPSGKRRLLAGQLLTIALLTKRLPLIRRGRTKRARCARSSAK